jgi:Lysyl oxidase
VEPPAEIVLQKDATTKQYFLRFSHTTANIGQGPLQLNPDQGADDCDDRGDRAMLAYQEVFLDGNGSGTFQRDVDTETTKTPVGCMIFHEAPGHNHYHFEDFAQYELYRVGNGALKETSDKVSFCVVDILNPYADLPGAPESPYYQFATCLEETGMHGISVGWADIYNSGTAGQEFEVTDLKKPGRFCLVARTDPADRLEEVATGGEDNNVQTAQIRVNKKNASPFGAQVPVLDKPCAPPATP